MLGNKLTQPNSRFLGHKYISQYTIGNKREPKNLSSNLILSQSKHPEIINNFNTSRQEPVIKYTK